MRLHVKYQIVALGGSTDSRTTTLFATLRRQLGDLGLSATGDVALLADPDVSSLDLLRAPTAVVFFGSATRAAGIDDAVSVFRNRGIFVLPVVPDVTRFKEYVPASLGSINGLAADAGDPGMESASQIVLEELRLVRDKRLVFVSYKRDESSAVAEQLYRAFDERAFDVFLDTHSVRGGAEFQSLLWDRMADADLLVLIDTPNALSSRWVSEELARAQTLGLGVVQLVWPGHSRTAGTEFCEPQFLAVEDFEVFAPGRPADARLKSAVLGKLVTGAEGLRARSLAARRTRVVGELCARASSAGVATEIQPARCIDLMTPAGARHRAFPIVGHPDSVELYRCFDACGTPPADGVVVYDPLGMLDRKRLHLGWLNGFLPLRAIPVTELSEWFRTA
jgi:hypothetical protein